MKENIAKFILVAIDLLGIAASIIIAVELRNSFNHTQLFPEVHRIALTNYLHFFPIYIITIGIFLYEGIYRHRYDFWHESRQIFCGCTLSLCVILSYMALSKSMIQYSRTVIVTTYLLMIFLLPITKRVTKFILYKIKLWHRPIKVYADNPQIEYELLDNFYLGYYQAVNEEPLTVFINKNNPEKLQELIDHEICQHREIVFVPAMNDYDLIRSHIYNLQNIRTNFIVLENRLKSKYRRLLQFASNVILTAAMLPILLPLIAVLAILIKRESSGPIFFAHQRVGKNGKSIPTFKFRTMYEDAQERLNELLKSDPAILAEWEQSFKLKNDPRITKIGRFLRQTSLDELPQIFNVIRGEMNFIGPRPVIQQEIDQYYREYAQYYFMVKPGITGLWQVSGRSDTDYDFRIKTDKWYVINWSIWLDIAILFKTIKVVFEKKGAY